MSAGTLPPLPRPRNWIAIEAGLTAVPTFSEEQITAYGQACRVDLEGAANLALYALENHSGNYKLSDSECDIHNAAVEALRKVLIK